MVGLDRPLPSSDPAARAPRAARLWLAALVSVFVAHAWHATASLPATARDQTADLLLALRMREEGVVSDGNRHPLLPAFLAPLARRDPSYFVEARAVSVVLSGAAVALAGLATAAVFGRGVALLAVALALLEFRFHARRIAPEPLVAGLVVAGAMALAKGAGARRPLLLAFAAGVALGLAWLAKGTAILSLAAALLWLPFARGRPRARTAGALLLGFALAGSPLLLWNVARHGSPFHNANTSHVFWEDAWDADLDRRSTATAADWFARHDAGDAARRLADGATRQKGVEWPYAFLALAAAGALLRRRPGSPLRAPEDPARRDARRLAVVSCLVWVPPFAWYAPIVASRRFLFPLVPLVLPPAIDLVRRAAGPAGARAVAAARRFAVSAAAPVVAAAAIVAVALVVRAGPPDPARHVPRGAVAAADALARLPRADDGRVPRVLAKPSRTAPPDWLVHGHATLVSLPSRLAAGERAPSGPAWARADAVLLSSGLLAQRREALAAIARWDDERGIVLADPLPAGLRVVWRDPSAPVAYVLLATSPDG
jgi:4-amino-4-deoxy-L-arabinose transferase-like glycosyltransferase